MRAYIIEDVEMMREVIFSFINSIDGIDVVGSAGDGNQAMAEMCKLQPDLVFTDITLPEVNGMEILYLLKRKFHDVHVIIFTSFVTEEKIRLAFEGGADGFIEKGADMNDFREAIDILQRGGRYFDKALSQYDSFAESSKKRAFYRS
ncbi:response regulator transcription factor [Rubellicoccus peritrichatus]|uniref:Response regulator transcription factor n=1 Tax=Rubellicoccus peritrichatus TaxID=3080537 RepID=A0AAQ3QWM0_9BACT|nr:response regulator transcription factor [Puniceicoccus sp. CR14]WOO42032.1 response regulator transcription factor [Puniceicoccus sp. CR14]